MGLAKKKEAPAALFDDAMRAYRQHKHIERRLTPKMEAFIRFWEARLTGVPLVEINDDLVSEIVVRDMSHMQPNSISRYMTVLMSMLRMAVKKGLLERAPFLSKPSYFDERDEHLELIEVEALLEWAFKTPAVRFAEASALLVLLHTGVRVNELVALQGRHFGPDGLMVAKKAGKTRDTRFIPYSERMQNLKRTGFANVGDAKLFGVLGRTPNHASHRLAEVLGAGLKAIGVTRKIRVHDLRHTFAYMCGVKGIDLGDLQLLLGHANIQMTMRYRGFIRSRAVSVLSQL